MAASGFEQVLHFNLELALNQVRPTLTFFLYFYAINKNL
jgi:hypothetical protein